MYPLVSAVKCFIPFFLMLIVFRNEIDASKIICKNNGEQTTENSRIICQCPYPFTGLLCEDYACVNGLSTGDQYKPDSAFFNKRCLCDAGWTGELCETSLINRCGLNGRERRGKCMCQKNFVGDRCQFVSKCAHGQLYNGRCSCHYGWTGDFCDKIICYQGKRDETNETCNCPPKYHGRFCDICAHPASSPPPDCSAISGRRTISVDKDTAPVLLIIVITVTLAALGAVIYVIFFRIGRTKKTNKTRKTAVNGKKPLSPNAEETSPLQINNDMIAKELANVAGKFCDAPPPAYDSIIHHQTKAIDSKEAHDSGFDDSYGRNDTSSKNSSDFDDDAEALTEKRLRTITAQLSSSKLSANFVDEPKVP